jgi:outer membrane protein insertion porin family
MKIFATGFPAYSLRSSLLIPLLLSLLTLAGGALAQTPSGKTMRPMPSSAYKLIAVNVTGSKRFTSEEVGAASGLPIGTVAHEEDFKKAARQLGESGAFNNIAFTYSYSSAGTKLEFQVTDADKFVPVGFTDFVWFSDEELRQRLHERIPLFKGELPTSGRLPQQVSDVLQAMLVERAVPGIVEFMQHADKGGKVESIDYNVAGVSIRIHHAEFPGAGAGELPTLQDAAEKMVNREYSRAYMNSFVEQTVVPILHEHGYLKAACGTPQPRVVKPASSESGENRQPPTSVDVSFPVTPGVQYKLTGWVWSGNKAISANELQPLLHAKAGQVANTLQLTDDLRAVQELYGSRGYILAAVKVNAEFDDAAGSVAYHLVVNEDSVFHMGELEFRGIDNNLTARLRAAWKLRPGDVYDSSYLKEFLPQARKLLPASLDWEVSTHVTALARDKTVDVDLQYTAKAPQ